MVLFSLSMYKKNSSSPVHSSAAFSSSPPSGPSFLQDPSNDDNANHDIFLQYFFQKSIHDMKISYTIPNDSVFFGSIVSIRLVKSLIENGLSYNSQIHESNAANTELNQGILLPKIYQKLMNEQKEYLLQLHKNQQNHSITTSALQQLQFLQNKVNNENNQSIGYNNVVNVMKQMVFGKFCICWLAFRHSPLL
jgi:hypothetical protein